RPRQTQMAVTAAFRECEGRPRDRVGHAVLRSARGAFALEGYLRLGARGGIEPQAGPGRCQQHHQREGKKQRPTAAGSGRGDRGGRHHGAPVPAKLRGAFPGALSRAWRLRRFKVDVHRSRRNDRVGDLRATPRSLISHPMDPNPAHAANDLWVFAYGSLMWRPDFPFAERIEARLVGAHRALCVYSFVHRGTPERPGLVLGLDHGGTCRGIAYRVAAADRSNTVAYLRAREQVTSV